MTPDNTNGQALLNSDTQWTYKNKFKLVWVKIKVEQESEGKSKQCWLASRNICPCSM